MIKAFLKQIRINHYVKNFLVFAPLFFSGHVVNQEELNLTILLFVAFCLLASSIYVFNDILDRESDAKHPRKKHRPIASGKISVRTGFVIIALFLILAAVLASQFNVKTNILLSLYIFINAGYSLVLKHVPILDIFLVAALYLIRIKAGGELIDVEVSDWLLLVTLFLALFLVIGKRRAEFVSKNAEMTRKVLKGYTKEFLDYSLVMVASGVLFTYTLYAISIDLHYLVYSTFFVFFGMFRYMYIVYVIGGGEAPEKILFRDVWLLVTILGWAFFMFFIFYNGLL